MNVRGFALLAVLWLLVALTAVGGVALATTRLGAHTTRNRVLLARAAWAREACVEILHARYAQHPDVRGIDTVDLGRGTWCMARVEDPGAKLNLNAAEAEELRAVFSVVRDPLSADSIVVRVVARRRVRPFADVRELADLALLDSSTVDRLAALLTTRGSGQINLGAASPAVLATVPGLTNEAIEVLLGRRTGLRPLHSADELAAALSPSSRALLYGAYQDFLRATTFAPSQLVVTVVGGVRRTQLVARETLTAVPLPERLAIVRREAE